MRSMRLIAGVFFALPLSLAALALGWSKTRIADVSFRTRPLLNAAELDFYRRLRHALPEYQVLPQVSLAALMRPVQARRWRRAVQDRIARARVLYVIAARTDLSVLAFVELDDEAPARGREVERDRLAASAGYPTHRFSGARSPSPLAIRERLLGPPTAEIVLLPRPGGADRPTRS